MSERLSSKVIDQHAEKLCKLAKDIWDNPEMGWTETKAVEWTAEYLKEEGFETEVGAYGMPTAIRAVWGKGHPVIGFCAEYDCLPGLSQKVSTCQDPVVPGGIGHGCGHNLLGVGCLGAVVGLKAELEASGKEGTVIFYGCPAEEQLTAKGFMAKNGAFKECDFTIAWHPGSTNQNTYGTMNGIEGAIFRFHGKTSHAAANPQDGRSALDAVQLMNMGVEFLSGAESTMTHPVAVGVCRAYGDIECLGNLRAVGNSHPYDGKDSQFSAERSILRQGKLMRGIHDLIDLFNKIWEEPQDSIVEFLKVALELGV